MSAAQVVAATATWSEPRLSGDRIFWLERRPTQAGRTALLCRPWQPLTQVAAPAVELTPPEADLRTRVHEYGGGAYCVASDRSGTTVVWVDDRDRCLWSLWLPPLEAGSTPSAATAAHRLTTPDPERRFADGLIDLQRRRWIGVLEQGEREALVSVPLAGGDPVPLRQPPEFCGYAVLSPSGSHLAWIEWRHPAMPWQRSQLWLGRLSAEGTLQQALPVAGSAPGDTAAISVFQPLWIPRGTGSADLVVACDRSGWWNLERLAAAESLLQPTAAPGAGSSAGSGGGGACRSAEAVPAAAARSDAGASAATRPWQTLLPMEAEFGMPQWVYGMATTAWDGGQLVAAACIEGSWRLGRLQPGEPGRSGHTAAAAVPTTATPQSAAAAVDAVASGREGPASPPLGQDEEASAGLCRWTPFALPFDDLAALTADRGRLVAIAASADAPAGLLELETDSGRWRHTPAAPCPLSTAAISRPRPLWFPGHAGRSTHAWYYPPTAGADAPAPLLVRGHSGPTAMARTGLNLSIQFWCQRGWGVLDVNYGGSTGFGRAYRQRLDGQWGVVDVDDCVAAARAAVARGLADPDRIAMEGGSAAGFTVLAALCEGNVFRAGACRYAVTDLESMARHTHRFEAHYLDSLIGPWPEAAATYRERSPLLQAERIRAPLILFQGLDDRVVPPDQTERMALALSRRGIPVEVHLFEAEGHGFRSSAVQIQVLEASEAFFRRHLQLA